MGVDKSTLAISGEPLWRRQLRILAEVQPSAVWISARSTPSWCPAGIEVILDGPRSRGPLSGVAAGLERLRTSHLLVLAVDLPRVPVEHLRKLCNLIRPGCGVIPQNTEGFEPLCAVYPVEAAPNAREALASHNLSLQHFARTLINQGRLKAYRITPEERAMYLNVNYPADLEFQ